MDVLEPTPSGSRRRKAGIDARLVGIMMLGMDGLDATRVLLDAEAVPADRRRNRKGHEGRPRSLREGGAGDYLSIPGARKQLLSSLRVWLYRL